MAALLKKQHEDHIAQLRARGRNIVTFDCPACESATDTLAPEDDDVWDTPAQCPECNAIYKKVVTREGAEGHLPMLADF